MLYKKAAAKRGSEREHYSGQSQALYNTLKRFNRPCSASAVAVLVAL
jgi:hypothetical protein